MASGLLLLLLPIHPPTPLAPVLATSKTAPSDQALHIDKDVETGVKGFSTRKKKTLFTSTTADAKHLEMAPPTIAELAAAGLIDSIEGLNQQEQLELLIWARQQGMSWKAIKARWGFPDTEDNLRQRHLHRPGHNPPRVPIFTATDDALLLQAVNLYATGPLDREESLQGIWKAVKEYILHNGGTTTASVATLKTRWQASRAQAGPLPPGPFQPRGGRNPPVLRLRDPRGAASSPQITGQASLARSFPVLRLRNQAQADNSQASRPDNANGPAGSNAGAANLPSWNHSEYPPLSEEEMREVLGSDEAEDLEQGDDRDVGDDEDSSGDTPEDPPRPGLRPRKG